MSKRRKEEGGNMPPRPGSFTTFGHGPARPEAQARCLCGLAAVRARYGSNIHVSAAPNGASQCIKVDQPQHGIVAERSDAELIDKGE